MRHGVQKMERPLKIAIKHRTGTVRVGEPSVIIAVSSAHREASLQLNG